MPLPQRDGIRDFDGIVATHRSKARNLLQTVRPHIATAYCQYIDRRGNGKLLDPVKFDNNDVIEELKRNFRSLDRGESYDVMRDAILGTARFSICPYCNVSRAVSLDHVLPREFYPEFSVLAQNLVPACTGCNRKKASACYKSTGNNLMHPYYDLIPTDPILFVEVTVNSQGVTWNYYLKQGKSIKDDQFEVINNLFDHLNLAGLYSEVSTDELLGRLGEIHHVYNTGGLQEVEGHLRNQANSSSLHLGENHWKTALLRALGNSTPFCDKGFMQMKYPH